MTKRITTHLKAPYWYPLDVYKKNLSAIELLNEIFKRYSLKKELTPLLNQQQQEALFSKIILRNDIIPASSHLRKSAAQAIKSLSVFEALNIANQIRHSDWYQAHESKNAIEEVLDTLAHGQHLNSAQKKIVETLSDIPWYKFLNHSDEIKCRTQIQYSNGVPVTIDTGIYRDEILTELRNFLTKRQGKKLWALSPEIFETWKRKSILAIFDLQTWFQIKQIKYKKNDLWHIIHGRNPPESPINKDDIVDAKAFIKSAIKESARVIQLGTIRPLWMYCETEMWRSNNTLTAPQKRK